VHGVLEFRHWARAELHRAHVALHALNKAFEGKKHVDAAPALGMVAKASIGSWDQSNALAPAGWKSIFRVD
jgi:hypothetical protein